MKAVAASVKARGTGSGEGIYPHDERREGSRDGSPRVGATRAAGARLTGQSAPRARTSRQEIAGCLHGEITECQHGPSASPAHDAAPAPGSRTGAVTTEARDA